MMLSKELLSEVLKVKLFDCPNYGWYKETFRYCIEGQKVGDIVNQIDIYELVHKCREWVRNEGYYILRDTKGYINGVTTLVRADDANAWKYEDELEPESIFKATQWIFDNLKEK